MATARAASLGSFGLVAGLAAAATLLPDGCTITNEGSLHLREGVPIATPLLFGLLGLVLAKKAHWAFVQAVVALVAWSLVIALLGTGRPSDTLYAPLVLGTLAFAALAIPPLLTRTFDPWPWVAAIEGVAVIGLWADPRRQAPSTFDFGLAWSALGAHAFVTVVAACTTPRPWRGRAATLVGAALGALLVGVYVVVRAPPFVPSHPEPFSIWHGC